MTTIMDFDTSQVLGVSGGRDHKGVGDWPFARPAWYRGRRDRPFGGVPESVGDVASAHRPRR
jgi:hypothetical protein